MQSIGGRQLPYNVRQQVFPNGTMVITNVERKEDATTNGAYTCVARNDEGYSARSDLQVSVMGKSIFLSSSLNIKVNTIMKNGNTWEIKVQFQ